MSKTQSDNVLVNIDPRGVCTLTMNRPDKHNAFDDTLIKNLLAALIQADNNETIRMVIITGSGASFSSGADLNWMRAMANVDHTTNYNDALQLAALLHTLYSFSKPTIARVNGAAFGGAVGLIACCDIAISVESARFAFTEVLLGIIPAVIAPYVVTAIGPRQAKRLFLSAEKFSASDAQHFGLLHICGAAEELDNLVETQAKALLKAGPLAQKACKQLIQKLSGMPDDIGPYTAELIAQLRTANEGQEGLSAFLEKRAPQWAK